MQTPDRELNVGFIPRDTGLEKELKLWSRPAVIRPPITFAAESHSWERKINTAKARSRREGAQTSRSFPSVSAP